MFHFLGEIFLKLFKGAVWGMTCKQQSSGYKLYNYIYISRKKWHNEKVQYIKSSKNKLAENVKVKVSLEKEIFHVYKIKHLDWNMLKINM